MGLVGKKKATPNPNYIGFIVEAEASNTRELDTQLKLPEQQHEEGEAEEVEEGEEGEDVEEIDGEEKEERPKLADGFYEIEAIRRRRVRKVTPFCFCRKVGGCCRDGFGGWEEGGCKEGERGSRSGFGGGWGMMQRWVRWVGGKGERCCCLGLVVVVGGGMLQRWVWWWWWVGGCCRDGFGGWEEGVVDGWVGGGGGGDVWVWWEEEGEGVTERGWRCVQRKGVGGKIFFFFKKVKRRRFTHCVLARQETRFTLFIYAPKEIM